MHFIAFTIYAIIYRLSTIIISARILLENFEFKAVIDDSETFHIKLAEMNTPPLEWDGIKVLSKGFFPEIVIQDFPIRCRKVFYHTKRHRWLNTESSKVIYRK